MTITFNSWKPDTCKCVLHYYYDGDLPPEQIVTTFFAIENVCPDHAPLTGLDKGEPEWEQPDHKVETENPARLAMIEAALERNEEKNIDSIRDRANDDDFKAIQKGLKEHNKKALERYAKIFDPLNATTISKAIFNSVDEENKRKNKALATALEHGPPELSEIKDGGVTKIPKDDIGFEWSFSGTVPNRKLAISFKKQIKTNDKNTIRSKLTEEFGDKVELT